MSSPCMVIPDNRNFGTFTDLAVNFQRSSDLIGPFSHIIQTKSARCRLRRIEAVPVINNMQGNLVRLTMERNLRTVSP